MSKAPEKKKVSHIYNFHKAMQENELILVWQGEFNQEIMKSVLAMTEHNMEKTGEESKIKRKVFNIMVECLQNIVKHADDEATETVEGARAIFMIGKSEGSYIIATGNMVSNDKIESIDSKIQQVNSLDRDGLKALYKDVLKHGNISEKGGAGLGLIDMARKSGKKLEYDFEPVNDQFSFFSFQILIGTK